MSKQEFIDRLKAALNGRVAPNLVQENVNYYEEYINTQIRMGRSESEVLDTLGDPRLIAKTIIETSGQGRTDTYDGTDYQNEGYRNAGYQNAGYQNTGNVYQQKSSKTFHIPGWVWLIIVVLVVVLIFSMVFSVLSFLAPVLVPILVVVFLVKLFRDWLN